MARGSGQIIEATTGTRRDPGAATSELRALAELDRERFTQELARRWPDELTGCMIDATERREGGRKWWETYDRFSLRRPRPARWSEDLFYVEFARWAKYSARHERFVDCVAYKVTLDELVGVADALERGETPHVTLRRPIASFVKGCAP